MSWTPYWRNWGRSPYDPDYDDRWEEKEAAWEDAQEDKAEAARGN